MKTETLEREMRFELTTSTLARLHSTAELFPQKDAIGSSTGPGGQGPSTWELTLSKRGLTPFLLVAEAVYGEHSGGPPGGGDRGDGADQECDPDCDDEDRGVEDDGEMVDQVDLRVERETDLV
jgi:hypothetical protein